jgi:transposase
MAGVSSCWLTLSVLRGRVGAGAEGGWRRSREAVDAIVARVVVDHIDDARLDQLYPIGVDEISYKRGRKFLTIVADHDTGTAVWVGRQRSKTAFEEFFTALGP